MSQPGWAVELIGQNLDLDHLREAMILPFDPYVENYEAEDGTRKLLLRSKTWSKLKEPSDVIRDAHRMIERINGELVLLDGDAQPVKAAEIIKFGADGKREPILFAATGEVKIILGNVRVRARATTMRAAGGPPQESPAQRWFREAEADGVRAELFSHLSRADNWFDLYKAAELARRVAGGKNKVRAALGADWADWDRAWQTANVHRHAPDPVKFPLPPNPPDLRQAREIILSSIARLV